MNWEEMQDKWDTMQVLIQSYWPELFREDLSQVDGCCDKLLTLLQSLYGLTEADAGQALCRFENEVRFPGAMNSNGAGPIFSSVRSSFLV
jgi:hypothetical protein